MAVTADDLQVLSEAEEQALLAEGSSPEELKAGETKAIAAPNAPLIAIEINNESDDTTGASLTALQGIIERQSKRLDDLREETRLLSEQLKAILDNDLELTEAQEQAKQATRKQKERKAALANNAESTQLRYKLKEAKENIKDIEESLNNHLLNFFSMTGVKEFDTTDGGKREFDVRAKLRGKPRKKD